MVGEDSLRRHDESAIERADGERGPIGAQQLLEPLQLPLVVAENDGGWWIRDDLPQPLQIAVDVLGRRQWKAPLELGVR